MGAEVRGNPVQASSGSHQVFPVGEDDREEWIVAFEELVQRLHSSPFLDGFVISR